MLRTARSLVPRLAVLFPSLLAACGGDDASSEPAAGSGGSSGGAAGQVASAGSGASGSGSAAYDKLYGYFNVTMNPALEETSSPPYTTLVGKLYDGPYPPAKSFTAKMEANGCTLYTPNVFFCQPQCGASAVCTADDTCTPYPALQTVGSVNVQGLGPAAFVMEPKANNYQPPAGTSLPFPPCTPGGAVKIEAMGGNFPGFDLATTCIEPLELEGPVALMKGKSLTLTWNKGPVNERVNVNVLLDISQHGTSKGNITCDVADTGTLTIPSSLVDALLDLGISGFPTVLVTREIESVPKSGGPAHVYLKLSAPYRRAVEIPGLVSCNDNSQCPSGQTCQTDLKCM